MNVSRFTREGNGQKVGADFGRRDHVGLVFVGQRRR